MVPNEYPHIVKAQNSAAAVSDIPLEKKNKSEETRVRAGTER